MDGFLSNNWRDILALIGVAFPLLQSLGLLREWASRNRKKQRAPGQVRRGDDPRLRLGLLEQVLESEESSPKEKQFIQKALAISGVVMVAGSIVSSIDPLGKGGFFVEMAVVWSWLLMILIAIFHEIGLIVAITRYLSSRIARENHGLLGSIQGISLSALFVLSYWVISNSEGKIFSLSWFLRLLSSYVAAYLIVFGILCLGEIVWQVDEWQERRKKK